MNFNNNELMIISKYLDYNDYNTYFKLFPNLNKLYHTTFNYININIHDCDYVHLKSKYTLNLFPNVETVIINIDFRESKYYYSEILLAIIKIYENFSKIYPDKFVKLIVSDKHLCIYFKNKILKYFNTINELIENDHLNNNFRIYISDCYEENYNELKKYKFIKFIKHLYSETNSLALKSDYIYAFRNRFIFKFKKLIKDSDDLKEIYIHEYNNTIFKKLNHKLCIINGKNICYEYLFEVKRFPSYYELAKSKIKLSTNKIIHDYIVEYKNKLNLNIDNRYIFEYLFGHHPLKLDVTKTIYDIKNISSKYIYNYYDVVNTLNIIFKNE